MEDLNDERLLRELLEFGVDPGKINDKRRPLLIKQLNHLRARQRQAEEQIIPDSSSSSVTGRVKSTGSRKKSGTATALLARHSSSENETDDDINENRRKAGVPDESDSRQGTTLKMRRRTVDIGLLPSERQQVNGAARADDSVQKTSTPKSRRSVDSSSAHQPDSPFLAGSLRVGPPKTHSPARYPSRSKSNAAVASSGYVFNDDLSGSDNDASFVELQSMGVNTTLSLESTPSKLSGDFKSGGSHRMTGILAPPTRCSDKTLAAAMFWNLVGRLKSACNAMGNAWSFCWCIVSHILPWALLALFIILGLLYGFAIQSDTKTSSTMGKSADFMPCDDANNDYKMCLESDEIPIVRELVVDIIEILSRRAGDYECGRAIDSRFMTRLELESVLKWQYGKPNAGDFDRALAVVQKNRQWGIQLLDAGSAEVAVGGFESVKFLESNGADRSLWCRLSMAVWRLFNRLLLMLAVVLAVVAIGLLAWFKWKKSKEQTKEVHRLVDDIISLLQNHARSCRTNAGIFPYVAIPHVRDALIPLADRKCKQEIWLRAVKFLSMNESRVREEVKSINGEECYVWRWIDTLPDNSAPTAKTTDLPVKTGSSCLRICNMLNPAGSYSSSSIYDAVLERCGIHSGVLHVGTCSDVPDSVYVKFVSEAAAKQACQHLHGWQFEGKLTSVRDVDTGTYRLLFPESISAMVPLRSRRQSMLLHPPPSLMS